MRKIITALLLILTVLFLPAQQAKRVYITLDVSGSMTGNKYALANYTTQMIVSLCGEDDDIYMIVYGQEKCLSNGKNPLSIIQKPMEELSFGSPKSAMSQIDDIIGFNEVYKPSKNKQNWLFIIGDGWWATPDFPQDIANFRKIVEGGTLNVCYLQTGESLTEHSDFTEFAEDLGVVDIGKSATNPESIKKGCDHFARKILGFSDVPLKVKKDGKDCISIKVELPVKSFYLVYQDGVTPSQLPQLVNATANGNSLNVKLKGTPTTIPCKSNYILPAQIINMSGNVWEIKSGSVIPANTEIKVCFDKAVDPDKFCVYPLVEDIEFASFGVSAQGGNLKQIDSKTYCISSNDKKAIVRIELNDKSKQNLPESLLKKTSVIVKANNKEYKASYKNGGFECTIDIKNDETQYYAECDCPGYFKRVTSIMTIKKGDCEPEPVETPTIKRPPLTTSPVSFSTLKNGALRVYIYDEKDSFVLDPNKFDIDVDVENGFLYEDPKISFDGDTILLDIRPKGNWCECIAPKEVNVTITYTPKNGAFDKEGVQYSRVEQPIQIPLVKDSPWLSRCFWVLVTLVSLLVFMIYLRALLKKKRFHRSARIKNSYYEEDNPKEIHKNGRPLRREGFAAWFNRWLNPFVDEQNTISFVRPKTSPLTFTASESKNKVWLSESSFDPKKMTIPNFTPPPKDNKRKGKEQPIQISEGLSIEIKRPSGSESFPTGHLKYSIEGKDDTGGYYFFIGLLIVLSIISFATLLFLLIRGL